jgi:hypothetical protein
VVHVSVEEISRGWMWKYIPRPGEKVPKPRGSAGVDGMRIGTGGDGVEVAKTVWMTRTRSSNDRRRREESEECKRKRLFRGWRFVKIEEIRRRQDEEPAEKVDGACQPRGIDE